MKPGSSIVESQSGGLNQRWGKTWEIGYRFWRKLFLDDLALGPQDWSECRKENRVTGIFSSLYASRRKLCKRPDWPGIGRFHDRIILSGGWTLPSALFNVDSRFGFRLPVWSNLNYCRATWSKDLLERANFCWEWLMDDVFGEDTKTRGHQKHGDRNSPIRGYIWVARGLTLGKKDDVRFCFGPEWC